jgi:hypothetical protein
MFSSLPSRLFALIVLSIGCADPTKSASPITPPPTLPPAPAAPQPAVHPTPPFPPLSHAGVIFTGAESLYDFSIAYHGSHLGTRFVLYDSTTFGLQFSSYNFGFFEYAGHYTGAASGGLSLTFDENDPMWQATGTLRGDSLSVKYSDWAKLDDFIDGVYVRSPDQ